MRGVDPAQPIYRLAVAGFPSLSGREFRGLLLAQTGSQVGAAMAAFGASLLLLRMTGDPAMIGLATLALILPQVVLGARVERVLQRRSWHAIAATTAVLFTVNDACLLWSLANGEARWWSLLVWWTAIGAIEAFNGRASQRLTLASIPVAQSDKDELAVIVLRGPVARTVGFALGGLALMSTGALVTGVETCVIVSMWRHVLEPVALTRLNGQLPSAERGRRDEVRLLQVWAQARSQEQLWMPLVGVAAMAIPVELGSVIAALSTGTSTFTYLEIANAAGIALGAVGAVAFARWSRSRRGETGIGRRPQAPRRERDVIGRVPMPGPLALPAAVWVGVGDIVTAETGVLAWRVAALLLVGVGAGAFAAAIVARLLAAARGQDLALIALLGALALPACGVGALTMGLLARQSPILGLRIGGALAFCVAILLALARRRAIRHLPAEARDAGAAASAARECREQIRSISANGFCAARVIALTAEDLDVALAIVADPANGLIADDAGAWVLAFGETLSDELNTAVSGINARRAKDAGPLLIVARAPALEGADTPENALVLHVVPEDQLETYAAQGTGDAAARVLQIAPGHRPADGE